MSITLPANGATVAGAVAVGATAADEKGVARVEFSVDGTLVSTSASAPYGFSWNAAGASAASHTIVARAFDAAGTSSSAQVAVSIVGETIAPKAPGRLKAPVIGTTQVVLTWVASTDNVGVAAYEIFRDGVQIGETSLPNYLDTGLAAGSTHKYRVRARDAAGNGSALTSALAARLVALSPSGTGTVAGIVFDAAGKAAPNAVVQLSGNGTTKSANTSSSGAYKFSALVPGDYTLTINPQSTLTATVRATASAPSTSVVGGVTVVVVAAT